MSKKLHGFEFFKSIGSPRYVIAPMVDQSELAWRLLGRKYGAELAYTPMFHASNFIRDKSYRKEAMEMSPKDRPLFYQFCSNDPETFVQAAKLVEDHCDAVDLNLGCPQSIAKRGHYGSYLQEEWDLISKMLTRCVAELKIPVTAKIRALSSIDLTVKYAKMIESCGVAILTIHGRTREQKGINTGLADWNVIKAVKDSLSIPVFANGNIQYYSDLQRCFEATGVDGIMSAEGHLHNPALFIPGSPKFIWDMAIEYLELAITHPCNISYNRGHVFKLLHHALHCHPPIRELVSSAKTVENLLNAVYALKEICGPYNCKNDLTELCDLPYKHWFCQPYIRPKVLSSVITIGDAGSIEANMCKRPLSDVSENNPCKVSKIEITPLDQDIVVYQSIGINKLKKQRDEEKRLKKEARQICKENKAKKPRQEAFPCESCSCNMRGLKCEYKLCKTCCKNKRITENIKCLGHVQWKSNQSITTEDNKATNTVI